MKLEKYILGLQHLGLPTTCYDETLKFYTRWGFNKKLETYNGDHRVCFLEMAGMVIEVYEVEESQKKSGAWDHIAINVSDVYAVCDHLNSSGLVKEDVKIQTLPFFQNGVSFFEITGPNGETVEFNQYL